jgi:hypothetical protein
VNTERRQQRIDELEGEHHTLEMQKCIPLAVITLMVVLVLGHMWLSPAKVTGYAYTCQGGKTVEVVPEHNLAHVTAHATGTTGPRGAAATFKVYQSPHVTSCAALEAHTPLFVSRGEPRLVVS